ncbi:MAG: DNRLRE domain-containing protein [Verrucomicrobiota bacterium JB024]|nr:DNRLRE domain-containing protein [Verrucomicrobiota bacterium JB024]
MTRTLLASTALMLGLATAAQAVDISFQNGIYPDVSYAGVQSTFVRADNANSNYNNYDSGNRFITGTTGNATNPQIRSLLSFDLSTLPDAAVIESVTLTLRSYGADGTSQNQSIQIDLMAMTESFDQTTATWNTSGTDYASTVLSSHSINPTIASGFQTWGSTTDFVAAVQSAVDGSGILNLMLKLPDGVETAGNRDIFFFYSDSYSTNQSYTPELSITYTIPEPATLSLGFGLGVGLLILLRRRARR